jgi:SAM-dependent methyltransferase
MTNDSENFHLPRHIKVSKPSPWIVRFAPLIKAGGCVLDLACGGGRHSRYFLEQGNKVVAFDRSTDAVADLSDNPACEVICADLETDEAVFEKLGELAERSFDAIIVVNYLHRPLFNYFINALAPGGIFIYETFARGNEKFTQPRNPDHLLKSAELLNLAQGGLDVIAYEHGIDKKGLLSVVIQRICAIKPAGPSKREDGEAEPQNLNL